MATIDLNSDLGEGFGMWSMGDDASMLDIVTSANVACGFHAGDSDIMLSDGEARQSQGRQHRRASLLSRPAWVRPATGRRA